MVSFRWWVVAEDCSWHGFSSSWEEVSERGIGWSAKVPCLVFTKKNINKMTTTLGRVTPLVLITIWLWLKTDFRYFFGMVKLSYCSLSQCFFGSSPPKTPRININISRSAPEHPENIPTQAVCHRALQATNDADPIPIGICEFTPVVRSKRGGLIKELEGKAMLFVGLHDLTFIAKTARSEGGFGGFFGGLDPFFVFF